ncbi:hypothetical protein B484DRAFT_424628 [Ochromonadaceae sp. CCMP2298]|nr:hypothetical protein B484DRAFT_424628 [Ochromonadaceae sp. CCMP2298]
MWRGARRTRSKAAWWAREAVALGHARIPCECGCGGEQEKERKKDRRDGKSRRGSGRKQRREGGTAAHSRKKNDPRGARSTRRSGASAPSPHDVAQGAEDEIEGGVVGEGGVGAG